MEQEDNIPTDTSRTQLTKINYCHDAMIDMIIRDPHIKQGDLAKYFGYTQSWLSTAMATILL